MTAPMRSSSFQVLRGVEHDRVATSTQHDRFKRRSRAQRRIEEEHAEDLAGEMAARRIVLPRARGRENAIDVLETELRCRGRVLHQAERADFIRQRVDRFVGYVQWRHQAQDIRIRAAADQNAGCLQMLL